MTEIKIRAVWPEVPEADEWAQYLQETKHLNWHSNFGQLSRRFENVLLDGYGHDGETVVATSNATSALTACLIGHNIRGPVLCPAFTFQASACAISGAGCHPVIVDVDPVTGVVVPETLKQALARTGAKAVLVVAPYGITTDFAKHAAVCLSAGARLIIDNAAGLGISRGRLFPRAAMNHVDEVFSLHATKPFGIGEGGAIFSAAEHDAALRSAINFGLNTHTASGQVKPPFWGINGKMSEAAAAVGLAVAKTMPERVANRQEMAEEWLEALSDYPGTAFGKHPEHSPWQVFPIILPSEGILEEFVDLMAGRGIELRRYYFPSLGACDGMQAIGDCANAQRLSDRAVVLPVRSWMPAKQRAKLMADTKRCLDGALA